MSRHCFSCQRLQQSPLARVDFVTDVSTFYNAGETESRIHTSVILFYYANLYAKSLLLILYLNDSKLLSVSPCVTCKESSLDSVLK